MKVDFWVEAMAPSRVYADAESTAYKQKECNVFMGDRLHVVEEYTTTKGVRWYRFDIPDLETDQGYPEKWVPASIVFAASPTPPSTVTEAQVLEAFRTILRYIKST